MPQQVEKYSQSNPKDAAFLQYCIAFGRTVSSASDQRRQKNARDALLSAFGNDGPIVMQLLDETMYFAQEQLVTSLPKASPIMRLWHTRLGDQSHIEQVGLTVLTNFQHAYSLQKDTIPEHLQDQLFRYGVVAIAYVVNEYTLAPNGAFSRSPYNVIFSAMHLDTDVIRLGDAFRYNAAHGHF